MFMFQTLKLIPAKIWRLDGEVIGILLFGVAGVIWTLLPFLERHGTGRSQRWILGAGIFAVAYMASMTVYGYLAK
jgi:quinol-cytochrome oxidoreductase complex cytochrome b subunit